MNTKYKLTACAIALKRPSKPIAVRVTIHLSVALSAPVYVGTMRRYMSRPLIQKSKADLEMHLDLLDMKQKQANVIEAHLAGRQSKVAANQSRTVMIFTIFTIIFLPLSFFASVFGINSKEWSGDGNNYLPLHNIFTYMVAISLAVIVVALLAAFSNPSRKLAMRTWKFIAFAFLKIFRPKSLKPIDKGGGIAGGYGRGAKEDLEKGVVETEVRVKESQRLGAVSRTQSIGYWDEKFERDMQKDGVGMSNGGKGLGINGCAVHE